MIYLISEENDNNNNNLLSQKNFLSKLNEDDVDIQLDKLDGRIPRQRDPQL